MNYERELGRLLVEQNVASGEQLLKAWREANMVGQDLRAYLVAQGILSLEDAERYHQIVCHNLDKSKARVLDVASREALRSVPGKGGLHQPIKSFGDYQVLKEIGRGGMGLVYKAHHRDDQSVVAIKVLINSHKANWKSLERMKRELEALRQLSHPNVVRFVTSGESKGQPFLVLEYVQGQTLRAALRERILKHGEGFELFEIVDLFADIASALSACHAAGLVHRDLKPGNVLIEDKSSRVVLIDFGLVRQDSAKLDGDCLEGLSGTLTGTGELVGSPAFMAPEQLKMDKSFGPVGTHTDVWCFGSTLYFALTGRSPFEEIAQSSIEIVFCLLHRKVPRLRSACPRVPLWLDKLCHDCLSKDSAARPTMAEIHARLKGNRDQLLARRTWPRTLAMIASVTMLIAIAALFLFTEDPDLVLLQLESSKYTRKFQLDFKISMNKTCSLILESLSKKTIEARFDTDEQGRHQGTLSLGKGLNRFRLSAPNEAFEKTFEVFQDNEPPRLAVDDLSEGVSVIKDGQKEISGQVLDFLPVEVFFNGQLLTLREGRFSYRLGTLDGIQQYKVEARDKAGNKTTTLISLTTRSNAEETVRDHLSSLSLWLACPDWQRRFIAERIALKLGAAYQYVSLKWFRCGGQSFQLAAYRHVKTGILLRLLPGGRYSIGSKTGARWEMPIRRVYVSPFLLGCYEVSQREWDRIGGSDKRKFIGPERPIEMVSWNDIKAWLAKDKKGLRLPSEAEWEYAARANTKSKYYWGDKIDKRYCWFFGNSGRNSHARSPLGSTARMNAFGLEDMLGNVWEWCEDTWIANYKKGPDTEQPRIIKGNTEKVLRGGSWFNKPKALRVSHRYGYQAGTNYGNLGFRVARSLSFK
jgi:serine/threonine protein kinase/formylglycine-generating enzyme required for sulfatase activity